MAVLVAGGIGFDRRALRNATIVDMDEAPLIPSCARAPRFPEALEAPSGIALAESTRVCGGKDRDGKVHRYGTKTHNYEVAGWRP